MSKSYTPAEITQITGVGIHTLRYYERIGLLDPVPRALNGHRRYRELDIKRLDFLKRVKATGMGIKEMLYYVELFRQGDSTITERREILEVHREKVREQRAQLDETLDLLDFKIENYVQRENAENLQVELGN